MKILHVVPTYYPAFKYGGPIHSTHLVNKKLVEKGVDITVFTTMDGQPSSTKEGVKVKLDGVNIYYFKSFKSTGYGISWSFIIELIKNLKHYDMVFLTSVFTFTSLIVPLVCLIKKKPYIISSRGTLDPLSINTKSSFIKKTVLALYERAYLNHANNIIVLMEDEKKWLFELGIKNKNVTIIPNGIDCNRNQFDTNIKYEKKLINLLYFGRLNYKKNIDLIIENYYVLCKKYNNIRLIIAGPDDGMEQQLKQIVNKLKLENKIVFRGLIIGEDKENLLLESDIFILPSISEGISMAQLEAMCAQCAIIVGNRGGIHKELRKYNAGIVINPSFETLKKALELLISNNKVRLEIAKNGFNLIKKNYSWDSIIDEYYCLFDKIIKDHKKL